MNEQLASRLIEAAAQRGFAAAVGPRFIRIIRELSDGSMVGFSDCTVTPTDEVLNDLIYWFENAETLEDYMNIYSTELFKYLAGDMIGNREITLTIAGVTLERMNSGRGGEQTKPCLHFVERDKMMVLNKSNAATIAKTLGPETDLWVGGRVTIAAPVIEAFGKSTRSLRVNNVMAAEVAAKPRGGRVATQPATAEEPTEATAAPLFNVEPEPAPAGAEYRE